MEDEVIECTSEEGIVIGLIDSILASANALVGMRSYFSHPHVIEALNDLRSSRNVNVLVAKTMGINRAELLERYETRTLEDAMLPR
jgi:hypothetical protein